MAMAHWFRTANLNHLREDFRSGEGPARAFQRRGVVFHIAPSNVDSVFIYSWLLSLLCGNANIARVSRRRTVQMQAFFQAASSLLDGGKFPSVRAANLVLSYDHDESITERLSRQCHLRVVWGGDNTIQRIRAIPLPPLASELAFANRFSMAVINADALLQLDDAGLTQLAQAFYNDAFWFNQQACSSPRVVVWAGEANALNEAGARFWRAVETQVEQKDPENTAAQVMDRTTTLFRLAHEHEWSQTETPPGALPSRIRVANLLEYDRACHDGNGLFIELAIPTLADLPAMLTSRDQTIAHFGITESEWRSLLPALPPHAADRIVPIGQALTFSTVWDGVDLLRSFTRQIQLGGSHPGR